MPTHGLPDDTVLLHFEDEAAAAQRLSEAVCQAGGRVWPVCIERHRFPDGELRLRLPPALPGRVLLLRSLDDPNEKLLELLIAAETARTLGAQRLTLLAPYLAYMRQDIAFNPGEAVSQRIVGAFLGRLFDDLITFDPHLHRVPSLSAIMPHTRCTVLSGAPLLADLIARRRGKALLIGPDAESAQWVAAAAASQGMEHAVCEKVRHGDRAVSISLPDCAFAGRPVVLLDNMASTGHTAARAAQLLLAAGAASVDLAVTHALFVGDACAQLQAAGIGEVWSTDCIHHASNAVPVAPALAQALLEGGVAV